MAKQNLVSAVLTDTDKEASKSGIATAKGKLPFLITLSMEDRSKNRKMGQKSVEYVRFGLRGAQNFPQYLPANFETVEFTKDVNIITQLWDVRVVVAAFLESIDDTLMAAGIDSMVSADEVYSFLKRAAKKDAAVKALVVEMAKKYTAQSKPKKKKTTTPTT